MRDEHIEKIMGECLGKTIGEHREWKDVTQVALANKLGKNHGSAVSDIETGKKRITKQELARICEALEVPVLDIIDQSFLRFRKKMAALGGESGGFLLGPQVTREEVESGFESLTGNANEWMSKYLRFAHPPTEIELLRYGLRKAPEGEGSLSGKEYEENGSRQDEE